MTAAAAETEIETEVVDGHVVGSTGTAPHCPPWASASNYDWPYTYHVRSLHLRNDRGEQVLQVESVVETCIEDGVVKVADPMIAFTVPGAEHLLRDGVSRLTALDLLHELCIVLDVTDIAPLLAAPPGITDSDPYRPAVRKAAKRRR